MANQRDFYIISSEEKEALKLRIKELIPFASKERQEQLISVLEQLNSDDCFVAYACNEGHNISLKAFKAYCEHNNIDDNSFQPFFTEEQFKYHTNCNGDCYRYEWWIFVGEPTEKLDRQRKKIYQTVKGTPFVVDFTAGSPSSFGGVYIEPPLI